MQALLNAPKPLDQSATSVQKEDGENIVTRTVQIAALLVARLHLVNASRTMELQVFHVSFLQTMLNMVHVC